MVSVPVNGSEEGVEGMAPEPGSPPPLADVMPPLDAANRAAAAAAAMPVPLPAKSFGISGMHGTEGRLRASAAPGT